MNKIFFILLFSCVFAVIDPSYHGFLDLRYQESADVYKGTGSFSIADIMLQVQFPLNKNCLVLYETHLTKNMDSFEQLYVDIDGFAVPLNLRLGRFYVPFGVEKTRQTDKFFINYSILRDSLWTTGNYLIPRAENGVNVYYHSRVFSIDAYMVNGGGQLSVENNDKSGKTYGTDLRFLLKDFLDVGFSLCYSDLSNPVSFGADNQYFLAGNDYKFSLGDFDFNTAFIMVSGKLSGVAKEGNGFYCDMAWHYTDRLIIGTAYSNLSLGGNSDARKQFSLSYIFNPEMTFKNEYNLDTISNTESWQFQSQLVVKI